MNDRGNLKNQKEEYNKGAKFLSPFVITYHKLRQSEILNSGYSPSPK